MSANRQRQATHQRDGKHVSVTHHAAGHRRTEGVAYSAKKQVLPGAESRVARRPIHAPAQLRFARIERQQRISLLLKIGAVLCCGIVALGVIYFVNTGAGTAAKPGLAGQYRFDIASPATGALAPDFSLPSTTGSMVRLGDYRGKNVLLYFQEGIGCEGCWTQIKDIQTNMREFKGLDIDAVVTITTNPIGALTQKVADEGLSMPVLSDESFAVSHAYSATQYGMMAGSADGHTFILVGPDGRIRWRADYGGPPNYTMYVPISNLIADIKAGMKVGANGS